MDHLIMVEDGDVEDVADVAVALLKRMAEMSVDEFRSLISLMRSQNAGQLSSGIDAMTDLMLSLD